MKSSALLFTTTLIIISSAHASNVSELIGEMCDLQIKNSQQETVYIPTEEEIDKMKSSISSPDSFVRCEDLSQSINQIQMKSVACRREDDLREEVAHMAPSEVIPEMYRLLESRYFETNPNFKPYYVEKQGNKSTKVRFRPYGIIHSFAYEHKHICIDTDKPCFYWTRRPSKMKMNEDFWWYEGRKYMPQIWDQWYTCWKIEMASGNVRTSVVGRLSAEMSNLGMYTLPYINEAIKTGDKTLDPLIQSINRNYTVNLKIPLTANFPAWYATNSWKYTLPPCEGLENARKRLAASNPDYVKELSGVILTNAVGEDISHLGNGWRSNFPKLEKGMAEYYANPPLVPKHWYYQLPDGLECSAWNPSDIFSPVTNVNFKAIETLKMMKRGKN